MSSKVAVRLWKNDEDNAHYFQVRVFSKKKKGVISSLDVPAGESRLEFRIAMAAGALAEQQNEKYKDKHNPDECVKIAVECFHDVRRKYDMGIKPETEVK